MPREVDSERAPGDENTAVMDEWCNPQKVLCSEVGMDA